MCAWRSPQAWGTGLALYNSVVPRGQAKNFIGHEPAPVIQSLAYLIVHTKSST